MKHIAKLLILTMTLGLAACANTLGTNDGIVGPIVPTDEPDLQTPASFDTSTKEERDEAANADAVSDNLLGPTLATLGNPSTPGFWLETPLVSSRQKGHVKDPKSGKSLNVDLIPISGERTSGSRLSLPAMRLLDLDLGAIVELNVYGD